MGTDTFEHAFFALRTACDANRSAVQNQSVAKIIGFLRVKNRAKLSFAFCRVFGVGEPQQVRYTNAVGVADDGGLAVNVAHHEVCGFSAYSWEFGKLLDGVRYNAAVIPNEDFAGLRNIMGLCFVKSAGSDYVAYILLIRFSKRFQSRVFTEENGRYHIDARIGALCRKACCDKQLVRLLIFERANRIGILRLEQLHRFCGKFFFVHKTTSE